MLSESQKSGVTAAFRQALQNAWYSGYVKGQREMTSSYRTPWQSQFDEWFDKKYGAIIEIE